MSDPTRRPLNFPTWHIPYLEKYRIYELFHEITRELVIQKPADHVLFMKHILRNAAKSKDVPRILIIKSPRVNCLEVAIEIAKITNQIVISENTLRTCLEKNPDECTPHMIAKCLAYLARTENAYSAGWIMVDCIKTGAEAKALVHLGILPTHVIHLIAPFHPDLSQLIYCNIMSEWPKARRNMIALREVFQSVLKEIHIGKRTLAEVVYECVELSKIRKSVKGIRPRLVLLGPRGCGRKTQATFLQENQNLVHVDFEHLICQAWMSESELGQKLRECKNEVCFHSELLSQVINKRILDEDCLTKGWVLTGFPYTHTDFKFLDSLETPPNRVIFLECDLNVCKERLRHRRVNVITGSVTDIQENPPIDGDDRILMEHPKNNEDLIDAELNFLLSELWISEKILRSHCECCER
ncbi:hypothetical protein NQ317_015335 [Molorchus minor]|uniref:Adenylate kinase 8 n=1 Tax=Molorchus minor TaxID=1323400 RepID=A0ABQ9JCU4_9CUCU|nr:hypothetical protein NQ317_015335 [Molorchus minor]